MAIWILTPDGTWKQAVPHVSNGTVYRPALKAYRYTGSSWQEIWARNVYAPTAPGVSLALKSGTKNVLNVTVSLPGSQPVKQARAVVKVGVDRWPVGPEDNDGCYYANSARTPNGSFEKWSEWWVGYRPNIPPGFVGIKQFPATEMTTVTLPLNTPIHVSAWIQDEHGVWSAAGVGSITTAKADAPSTPASSPPAHTPSLQPVLIKSASWFSSYTDNNNPYAYHNNLGQAVQGNTPYDSWGLLRSLIGFPSLTGELSGAVIDSIEVEVLMKHWHYSTGGTLSVGLHPHASTPGTFSHNASSVVTKTYTARGQRQWIRIPDAYYSGFANGTYKGISLYRQSNDPTYYGYADAMASRIKVTYRK